MKNIFEQTIEDLQKNYQTEAEGLLKRIELRDEMRDLLKIAAPNKKKSIQEAISSIKQLRKPKVFLIF